MLKRIAIILCATIICSVAAMPASAHARHHYYHHHRHHHWHAVYRYARPSRHAAVTGLTESARVIFVGGHEIDEAMPASANDNFVYGRAAIATARDFAAYGPLNPATYLPYIEQYAPEYGVSTRMAVHVCMTEGCTVYVGDGGTSFGPYQLHYGRDGHGLGWKFTRDTGLDARNPSTFPEQIKWSLRYASEHGWRHDWFGYQEAAWHYRWHWHRHHRWRAEVGHVGSGLIADDAIAA